jgi:HK97 family phage prohead protease
MTTMSLPERRDRSSPVTLARRDDTATGPGTLEGLGAVYYDPADAGTEYCLWEYPGERCVERLMPGCFDRACREDDVRALYNHEPASLLGRSASGTCRLTLDAKGLRYSIDLPDTHLGREVAELVRRGDLSGSSFAFTSDDSSYRVIRTEADNSLIIIREVRSVRLYDVGPVTYPAYAATTTGLRSEHVANLRKEYEAWRSHQSRPLPPVLAGYAARAREVQAIA